MFFLLNNEPCLMPVLLLGSFWLFEIPSYWVCSLISHAFVARFGEWKKYKWSDFFFHSTLGFLCKTFILPPIPSSLQSALPSSSCCAFFAPFLLRLRDNNVPPSSFLILSSLEQPRSLWDVALLVLRCTRSSSSRSRLPSSGLVVQLDASALALRLMISNRD